MLSCMHNDKRRMCPPRYLVVSDFGLKSRLGINRYRYLPTASNKIARLPVWYRTSRKLLEYLRELVELLVPGNSVPVLVLNTSAYQFHYFAR